MASTVSVGAVDVIQLMFNDVKQSWKDVLLNPILKPLLLQVITSIKDDLLNGKVCPAVPDIFNAFKYFEFNETKIVIVGQDPYPDPRSAMGLSFSARKNINTANGSPYIPDSLKNIYKCLEKTIGVKCSHPDLTLWAKQGILLLNSALTTRMNQSGMHPQWTDFTNALVSHISANSCEMNDSNGAIFVLWGNHAKKLTNYIDDSQNTIYTWMHPSPLSQRGDESTRFINCTNFVDINNKFISWKLPPPSWEVSNKTKVFTDGAAEKNGTSQCMAGYGIYFESSWLSALKGRQISGTVEPWCYALSAKADSMSDLTDGMSDLADDHTGLETTSTPVNASNNRAELLGIVYAFDAYLYEYETFKKSFTKNDILDHLEIELITDSSYSAGIVTEWMYKWEMSGLIDEKKNPDIVRILLQQAEAIKKHTHITIISCRAAHDTKDLTIVNQNKYDMLTHAGNTLADTLAHGYKTTLRK